ncbi:ATP-binding protein [Desulfurivibrio sp. C05AmB]|uniref:sensor histidine kinase n=1 Tax=Desulfurivibrio sp. C05AmB TaxID=3374371 RepID=UPI00376ECA16
MRKKAIIGFIVLTLFFVGGGIYITMANNRAIHGLEKVVQLTEVAHRRANLRNSIMMVQTDLLLADSPHASDITTVVGHGESMRKASQECYSCHHSEEIFASFDRIKVMMDDYLKKLSRVYTIRANRVRLHNEIEEAYASGQQLYGEVSRLSTISAHKIPMRIEETRAEIGRTKNLVLALVISGPLIALALIFFFIRRFTNSISVLTRATGKIGAGNLDHAISEPLYDEFQELAGAFNQMTASLKRQREQIAEVEDRYRILFESAVDAIFILEAEGEKVGTIVAANQAAATMHGYTVAEMIGMRIQDIDTPESAAKAGPRFQRLLQGERVEARVYHRKKDGTVFPVEFSAGLVEMEGKKYVLAFDRDITLRVRTEEALLRSRQLATVGEMAAGLAHEIKNPLAGIKISMEVLSNELELAPEDRDVFTRIVREIQRIENLLRNLLNYARPPKPNFSRLDLNLQVENGLKNAEMILKSPDYAGQNGKRIEFRRELTQDLPPVQADAAQLQQVLLNLLLNAVEAIAEEGMITLATWLGPDNKVRVKVADTGKGMPAEVSASIFQPFYTTKPKGNGLGLAISKRLVELHGGDIEVISSPGRGTTFIITLPREPEEQSLGELEEAVGA